MKICREDSEKSVEGVKSNKDTKAASLLPDLSHRELATVIPLAVLVFWIGLYPGPLMEMLDASVTTLVLQMEIIQPAHL